MNGLKMVGRRAVVRTVVTAAATLLLVGTSLAETPPSSGPDVSAFKSLEKDPRPKNITRDAHYVVSNENHHWLWHEEVSKLSGGVVSGVGSDQMYLLAGWAKAEVLVPMDFDQVIVDLHYVYGVMFKEAKTPDELIGLWKKDKATKKKVEELLKAAYGSDPGRLERAKQAHRLGVRLIKSRLERTARRMKKKNVPSVWTDQGQYDFVRRLWTDGRVFPIRGDLTASKAMRSIAKATTDSGLKMSVFYTSNAEQYFNWNKDFRENVLGLPYSDNGLFLRTFPDGQRSYYYYLQTGKNFQKWVARPKLRKTFYMIRYHRKNLGHDRHFRVLEEPRKRKKAKKK